MSELSESGCSKPYRPGRRQEGAAKRIDALAIAVWHEMTAEEITGPDLSHAPPFAPAWDPILIAARKAAEHVERLGRKG
ncbi:hypothetical protein ABZ260_45350 [Streptosporangium sp. NPDC006013]|uniref:hypothetical protein n=1 Tax=Streptosporangium sp. NPDC006013 TaxID=3155596 RepID=UPI0033B3595C